ncbi:epoxide hydrolase [Cellulomonas humilata]|uniref:Epoxide hydrolase n=1 Tax=Cellulomonas humilata TaxID=144055 RepID=A0A7Y6A0I7_9CELL|nr:epoxide hydrolase [Cellulomonas humilata]NUU16923.1 epoxide hydrolase [Cellulomonas humilata]
MTVRPFAVDIPQPVLDDLRGRLARTRFLDDSPRRPASGMSAAYLRELVASWLTFDWRSREVWLNQHPQFLADVDGSTLHFAHRRSTTPDAPALLVMHGWPHTFALQLDFAELLPDLDVVVVSMPGFAFSPPLDEPPTEQRLAALMHTLMTDVLGYSGYLTYGEDFTANVSDLIASTHPEAVAGIVVTHAHFLSQAERESTSDPTERAFYDRMAAGWYHQAGYAHVQGTRPDTLAAGLNDSPAGLLAWITEKLVEWSDTPAGDPAGVERRISRERILTEATLYWATQTIASSFTTYFDGADAEISAVEVPAAVFVQRHEHDNPESVARRFYRDLRVFERLPEGGHFTVAEVPRAMAERVRRFALTLR